MIQAVKCICGAIFSGCQEPECYTDMEYLKQLSKDVRRGCTVKMLDAKDFKFGECTCRKPAKVTQLSLGIQPPLTTKN